MFKTGLNWIFAYCGKRLRVYTLHNSFTFALGNKFKRIG